MMRPYCKISHTFSNQVENCQGLKFRGSSFSDTTFYTKHRAIVTHGFFGPFIRFRSQFSIPQCSSGLSPISWSGNSSTAQLDKVLGRFTWHGKLKSLVRSSRMHAICFQYFSEYLQCRYGHCSAKTISNRISSL